MCRTTRLLAEMVDVKNSDESVNLFCSSSCVMAFKVQTVSASGTTRLWCLRQYCTHEHCLLIKLAFFLKGARLCCDNCGKHTVPAYHLAMSDTSIRNFCTLPCVMAFQVQLSLCSIKTRLWRLSLNHVGNQNCLYLKAGWKAGGGGVV